MILLTKYGVMGYPDDEGWGGVYPPGISASGLPVAVLQLLGRMLCNWLEKM